MIGALCMDYAATGDASALSAARNAADWIAAHRSLSGGGFRHGDADTPGPYLGDTLAMGQAFLALYNVTGDRKDLKAAVAAAPFIAAHFAPVSAGSGFVTSQTPTDAAYRPHPDRDENIALVRFASMLAVATGDEHFHAMAVEAMRYLAAESVALAPLSAGVLLANQDVTEAPIHIAIVGAARSPIPSLSTRQRCAPSRRMSLWRYAIQPILHRCQTALRIRNSIVRRSSYAQQTPAPRLSSIRRRCGGESSARNADEHRQPRLPWRFASIRAKSTRVFGKLHKDCLSQPQQFKAPMDGLLDIDAF